MKCKGTRLTCETEDALDPVCHDQPLIARQEFSLPVADLNMKEGMLAMGTRRHDVN
jgi:hypothetical protein